MSSLGQRLTVLVSVGACTAGIAAGLPAAGHAHDHAAQSRNGKIAFASDRGGSSDVYRIEPDGSGRRNLTRSPGADTAPAWSPDGTRIAFIHGNGTVNDVYVMRADGSDKRNITHYEGRGHPTAGADGTVSPQWSPDQKRIAFRVNGHGNTIWIVNADGTHLHSLLRGDWAAFSWSPTGKLIALLGNNGVTNSLYALFIADADGRHLRAVTASHLDSSSEPSWSPDGEQIVFSETAIANRDITVMNADGSGQTDITHSADSNELAPVFSPDGNKIAFVASSTTGGTRDVSVMNTDGTHRRRLTTDGRVSLPSWQRLAG